MKKATVEIFRMFQNENQSSGNIMIYNEERFPLFSSLSLERGWRNNQFRVSCLPKGTYPLVLEWSPAFKRNLWEIKETEPRTECKFHEASFWKDLNGCISPGVIYTHINNDNYLDLKWSTFALKRFHDTLDQFNEVDLVIDGLDWIN